MAQAPAEEPQIKVTLNLNLSDVEYLKWHTGRGWTTVIRQIIREAVDEQRRFRSKRV